MKRRLVHRYRYVIATPGDVQEIAGLEDLVERCARGRYGRAAQPRAIHAIHNGAVEEPPLSSLQVEDEHLLIITMQIETVKRASRRVEVDVRDDAEGSIGRLVEADNRYQQFGDRIDCL